jgi:LysM repeat protein
MVSTIGIKIANGEFYPVLEENSAVKKRLILTTVHDDQKSVQIDLYKSLTKTMADAQYAGSLVIENISPKPKGAPSVELIISSDSQGGIAADAVDLDAREGKERYHLDISLTSLEEKGGDIVIPDFELESYGIPPRELYNDAQFISQGRRRSRSLPLLLFIIGGGAVIVVWLCIWLFLTRGASFRALIFGSGPAVEKAAQEPPMPEPAPVEPPPVPAAPPAVEAAPPMVEAAPVPAPKAEVPVIEAPAVPRPPAPARSRVRSPAPVARYKIPAVIPAGGVPYKIQWGDTLWEISEAFYRNPWLYPRIARFNNIRNPNRIISGTTIRIPPRN